MRRMTNAEHKNEKKASAIVGTSGIISGRQRVNFKAVACVVEA
jgi:hypothetical protein